MNLADVFTILFIVLGFLIVHVGYWLLAYGLFPEMTARCAEQLGRAPVKTTVVGTVTLLPLVTAGLVLSSVAPFGAGKVLGLAVALLALLLALLGSAGLALRIGSGLKSARDEQEPWRRVLRGGIVLALTFVMPFLGTFGLLPFTLFAGFGAFVLARRPRESGAPPPALPATAS